MQAGEGHFLDHLQEIWHALDPDERGTFTVHPSLVPRARAYGIEPSKRHGTGAVCVVASYGDERRVKDRPVVYLEHGAGQCYEATAPGHHSYSGGKDHDSVALFLCPNETVAQRWRARHPDARVEVIGAPPKLDHYYRNLSAKENSKKDRSRRGWHPGTGGRRTQPFEASRAEVDLLQGPSSSDGSKRGGLVRAPNPPVVATAFHWAADRVAPEAGTAWPTFGPFLDRLTEHFTVYGHGHPRCIRTLGPHYEHMGIEVVEDFDSILGLADILMVDNSSVAVEFASVGGPLVWLNSPNYRRDVHHQGRFWEWPEGQIQCDDPEDLVDAVYRALDDPAPVTEARERMVDAVFPTRDGFAAVRAADAIRNLLASPDLPTRRTRVPRTNPYAPRTRGTARRAVSEKDPNVGRFVVPPEDALPEGDGSAMLEEAQASFAEPVQALTGVMQPESATRGGIAFVRLTEDDDLTLGEPGGEG